MCHTSPPVYLSWAVLSSLLEGFLLFHLWKFDRFKCMKWNNGPYHGAFKRLMTYSYLVTVPLILIFAVGFAVIKYKMGYIALPTGEIIPTPYTLWPQMYQNAIFPLQLLFSFGWGFEIVTHLEELCFWLFLVHAASVQQDWFRSIYFRTWMVGAIFALYMPIVTIATRHDPLKSEAWTFLVGSMADLSLTLWFMPILFAFPKFLQHLKTEGVDKSTIVRLTTFHELNCIRVVFRYLFAIPLLILGADGVSAHPVVNESEFWTEFLAFVAAIGCIVSSGITLVIFFPRSVASELRAKEASQHKSQAHTQTQLRTIASFAQSERTSIGKGAFSPPAPPARALSDADEDAHYFMADGAKDAAPTGARLLFSPNRRLDGGAVQEGAVALAHLTDDNLARHNLRSSAVHPFVHNFTSPIDLVYGDPSGGSFRLNRKHFPDV